MYFIFSAPVLIRYLRQLKTIVFLHWCIICAVCWNAFQSCNIRLGWKRACQEQTLYLIGPISKLERILIQPNRNKPVVTHHLPLFYHFLTPSASGSIQTLDLWIMSWVFYHCATELQPTYQTHNIFVELSNYSHFAISNHLACKLLHFAMF